MSVGHRHERAALHAVDRHRAVQVVALRTEADAADHAVVTGRRERAEQSGRLGRIRAPHRVGEQHHRVVAIRREHDHLAVARLETPLERRVTRHPRARVARLRAELAFVRARRQRRPLPGAHAVAADERRVDSERLHLPHHRPRLCIGAAVDDHGRMRALHARENRREIDRGVRCVVADDSRDAARAQCLLRLIDEALAVGAAIVDQRDRPAFRELRGEPGERRALLVVGRHQPERGLVA
ncbi:hypothetical protein Y033_5340 [Burkholderia pseudomallei MSHR435]|nr:hypothetical protein Y033_5340 [Burkholderia pseudomallei MSHR435]